MFPAEVFPETTVVFSAFVMCGQVTKKFYVSLIFLAGWMMVIFVISLLSRTKFVNYMSRIFLYLFSGFYLI